MLSETIFYYYSECCRDIRYTKVFVNIFAKCLATCSHLECVYEFFIIIPYVAETYDIQKSLPIFLRNV